MFCFKLQPMSGIQTTLASILNSSDFLLNWR